MRQGYDIAIVGAGPAGCTLAALLRLRGFEVIVFDDDKRPDLLVGESLLPTVVSLIQKLGIEDAVRAVSQHKPGVAFVHREGLRMDFFFPERIARGVPNYAYNVPRPAFDNLLRERAEELGARFVKRRAEVEKGEGDTEVRLTRACLEATPELGGAHPKLLVDSTGRARVFAKALGIRARRGKRNDLAYFAHFENFAADSARDGQVVLSVLEHGWSWRIPLPGRLSVGVVVDKEAAKAHGPDPETRLESLIDAEPLLSEAGKDRRRITPVMTFTNYQLVSERGAGPGWVAVGDAHGFVDPMLSPGIMMAMHMAQRLDSVAFAGGPAVLDQPARLAKRFGRVIHEMEGWHEAWEEIIDYFYGGSIFSLYEGGAKLSEMYKRWALPVIAERHLTRQITRAVSGVSTRSRYARTLIACSAKHLVWGTEGPDFYAVR